MTRPRPQRSIGRLIECRSQPSSVSLCESGQDVGIREVAERIWLVTFMHYAIAQAQSCGVRLIQTCRVAEISARTIERWRKHPDGDDARCAPRRRPNNALKPTEETQILSIMSSSRFAHLSPKQLVPRLADQGLYLASESTFVGCNNVMGFARESVP